ncbi:serine/threonine protein kinase [bacterium]|nr:serine/threonine protein kinase [bacterium]
MASYADVICGRLLLREKLAAPEALFAALHEMKEALQRGSEMSLAEALERRAAVAKPQLDRVRDALERVQYLEGEKALARLVVDEKIAPPETVKLLVEEIRSNGFKDGLCATLLKRGMIDEKNARRLFQTRQIGLAEARRKRERALADYLVFLPPRFGPDERQRLNSIFEIDETPKPGSSPVVPTVTVPTTPAPPRAQPLLTDTFSREALAAATAGAHDPAPEDCPIYGYEILAELGKGAMGVVYKARHIATNRLTALKILPLKLARDSHYLERFKREAIAAMALRHENVVTAYDFGGSEEYYYLALEFVEGETLEKRLEREGRIPEVEALIAVRQVSLALEEASKRGIIHRDVKPDNIMITREGVAKLCDFGIVKLLDRDEGAVTVAGTTVGTPFYIAPEQARGEDDLDTRSDIYALGITLFHLVTGSVPFTGNSQGAILVRHILEEIPDPRTFRPEITAACSEIVKRMTRKRREDRYTTPGELIADIDRALAASRAAQRA